MDECSTRLSGGKVFVIACKPAPFGEVIGEVKGNRGRSCVFVVDEVDGFAVDFGFHVGIAGLDDDISTQKIAMSKDKLTTTYQESANRE